jgi:oxygen-independent coproporphyrinogen-3 oxidase
MRTDGLTSLLESAPRLADVESIRRALASLNGAYDPAGWQLPLPPWARRRYEYDGPAAWRQLEARLGSGLEEQPFCIYAHVPICSSKCGFCDSYSFKVGAPIGRVAAAYVEALSAELAAWAGLGNLAARPVSTVHLGGGTPTCLGAHGLTRLAECLRDRFNIRPDTEWALESTVDALTPEVMEAMQNLGFRRLHLGVQTLEDDVRRLIGRRRTGAEVLEKIRQTLAMGWIVSVDLICGLPRQTWPGFLDGIEQLAAAGVDGMSLYELLVYRQNRRWSERHQVAAADHDRNLVHFLSGAHLLERRNYRKNLFNHWAGSRDKNTYFTFPMRGEDLLAVGAIADGVFGNFHYRHPVYSEYIAGAFGKHPVLEGGLVRNKVEERQRPVATALLSGTFAAETMEYHLPGSSSALLHRWEVNGLIRPAEAGLMTLTPSGSWFAGNMIREAGTCSDETQSTIC